jgi:aryl-alcohol dehydrogenase-like predicted oxidoreductase
MQYRELGKTGLRVSLLGLGSVAFGRTDGLKYATAPRLPSLAELRNLLSVARDLGVNLIDTAPAYGSSEARLGELLAGQRNDWVLCTKVGETFDAGMSRWDFSPEHTRRSVHDSLRRLATDHLDVVLVHSNGDDLDIIRNLGTLQMLARLEDEGLIRAFGLSHKTIAGGMQAAETCDVVMATLSAAATEELGVVAHAHALGCGVLIKKPLDSGNAARDDDRRRSLHFVANVPGVSSIVIGTTNPAHLRDNAAVLRDR